MDAGPGGTSDPDLCWYSNLNATIAFAGTSGRLIWDATNTRWRSSADNALKIESFTGAGSPGNNSGVYWRVTTQDGTQYYFGKNQRYTGDPATTNSTLQESVYGSRPGDPCYSSSGFAASRCLQVYRWYLDYVVDPRQNTMTYFYTKYPAYSGVDNNTSVQPYDLTGTLVRIEYGTRYGTEGVSSAPMQVQFTTSLRCINTCQPNTSDYPDTPWDLYCGSSTSCPNTPSPVFFSPYDLSRVVTQVWNPASSSYTKVDQYDLAYNYPATG
jgi:hypothetical protein